MKFIKSCDLYRKVPRDLTEPTLSGAFVSCCTVLFTAYLFFSDIYIYMQHEWQSEMFIDDSNADEKLQINIDITMLALPCEVLTFDVQDVMGSHEMDAHGKLWKERLTSKGEVISKDEIKSNHYGASSVLTRHSPFAYNNQDMDKVRQMLSSGEMCRVKGSVFVNKVPGNVHLSTYSHSLFFDDLSRSSKYINISHTVNHLSFGVKRDIRFVKHQIKNTGFVAPLDGVTQVDTGPQTDNANRYRSTIFEYYTKVVPTIYSSAGRWRRPLLEVHQFTANSNRVPSQVMPSLYVRYDFSPVTVKYTEKAQPFSHLLVQMCAVLGGVYTIAGVVDSLIHKSIVHLAKKAQLGKLG